MPKDRDGEQKRAEREPGAPDERERSEGIGDLAPPDVTSAREEGLRGGALPPEKRREIAHDT
jgi:hypothetical protein